MQIQASIFLKTGIKNKTRIINLTALQQQLKIHLPASSSKTVNDLCEALVSLHTFTGCDSVSAFAAKGKVRPFKTMCTNDSYIDSFQQLGSSWTVSDDLMLRMEKFVCHMYGYKQPNLVNDLRYKMHCSKDGKINADLHQHILRANYQSRIWRLCMESCPELPSPDNGHGWCFTEPNKNLDIKWMTVKPAPEEVLALIVCHCKRKCEATKCCCIDNGLRCTDMCSIECNNMDVDDRDNVSVEETTELDVVDSEDDSAEDE